MSRYMVNKLMWEVERSDENLAAFKRDATGFVEFWEREAENPKHPYPFGGTLSPAERTACTEVDYAALYAMGAHPYLLWHFVRAVLVTEETTVEELSDNLKKALAPLGRPDFTT